LLKDITDIPESFVRCYDDHVVADLNGILSSGDAYSTVPGQTAYKEIVFQFQIGQRDPHNRRSIPDVEFQSFRLIIQDMVEGFNITSNGVLHGPHISEDHIGGQIFGINYASDIQLVDNVRIR